MKKTLVMAILAGAALAGCVKNEEVAKSSDTSPERITFDAPVVRIPTRAIEIADNFPTDVEFAVYALYHEGTFTSYGACTPYMNNVTCKHYGGTEGGEPNEYWAPTTDYYWPKTQNAMLTFAAYSPVMASLPAEANTEATGVKWDATGFTFQNFEITDPTAQVDVLYSDRVFNEQDGVKNNQNNSAGQATNYDGVQIPFKHALSSIVFTASAVTEGTVKLKGIEVRNVYSKATFNQAITHDTGGDSEVPKWSKFSKSLAKCTVYKTKAGEQPIALTATPTTFNSESSATNGKRKSDLLVIPQKLSKADRTVANGYEVGGGGATDADVIISYQIKNGDSWKDQETVYKLASGSDDNPVFEWAINKRYIYNISIGLNKIFFSAKVTDYTDGGALLVK